MSELMARAIDQFGREGAAAVLTALMVYGALLIGLCLAIVVNTVRLARRRRRVFRAPARCSICGMRHGIAGCPGYLVLDDWPIETEAEGIKRHHETVNALHAKLQARRSECWTRIQ